MANVRFAEIIAPLSPRCPGGAFHIVLWLTNVIRAIAIALRPGDLVKFDLAQMQLRPIFPTKMSWRNDYKAHPQTSRFCPRSFLAY